MPPTKGKLAYNFPIEAVLADVRQHFGDKLKLLPYLDYVAFLACFPAEGKCHSREFFESFAADPDTTIAVMQFARKQFAEYTSGTGNEGKVRAFILKHQMLVREKGNLRLPQKGDRGIGFASIPGIKFVRVDSSEVKDAELCKLIFGGRNGNYVETIKKARQSLSVPKGTKKA